jgi:hypothetical protein
MTWEDKVFVRPVCDKCRTKGELTDGTYWESASLAAEHYREEGWAFTEYITHYQKHPTNKWLNRRTTQIVRVTCPACITCEVCGDSEYAYDVDGHWVCEEHEDHEFPHCPTCTAGLQSPPLILWPDGTRSRCNDSFHQQDEGKDMEDKHIHHYVPVREGTWNGEPLFKLRCECGAKP